MEAACGGGDEGGLHEGGVGSRLKRGGMHWNVDGANAIIALRCAILSNRFNDFWERRANGNITLISQICRAPKVIPAHAGIQGSGGKARPSALAQNVLENPNTTP